MVARLKNVCKTCVLDERIIALNDMVFTNIIEQDDFKMALSSTGKPHFTVLVYTYLLQTCGGHARTDTCLVPEHCNVRSIIFIRVQLHWEVFMQITILSVTVPFNNM